MTIAAPPPAAIRARIDPAAISRVSSFFDAGIADILRELLQNSRRSGATLIEIHREGNTVRVKDDGAGIADPQALLSFGHSHWDQDAIRSEHPAGMGIYALARCEWVRITSRTHHSDSWSVELTPQHFVGEEEAPVRFEDASAQPAGTTVEFPWDDDIRDPVENAALHFPVAVTYLGDPVKQQDFLEDAVFVAHWEGLSIGVVEIPSWRIHSTKPNVNFHGATVSAREDVPAVDTLWRRGAFAAKVDVAHCPHLELTLPARHSLVRNHFVARLRQECLRAIYQAVQNDRIGRTLSRQHQQAALKMGIDLAVPSPDLIPWEPRTREKDPSYNMESPAHVTERALLVPEHLMITDQHAIARAVTCQDPDRQLLATQDSLLEGYEWYDRLERIDSVATLAMFGHRSYLLPEHLDEMPDSRPDHILIELHTSAGGSSSATLQLESDLAFPDEHGCPPQDAHIVVARKPNPELDPLMLADLLTAAYFKPSDQFSADSFHTQLANTRDQFLRRADELLDSPEAAIRRACSQALSSAGLNRMPHGTFLTATVQEDDSVRVEIIAGQHDA